MNTPFLNAQQALYNVEHSYPDDRTEVLEDAAIALQELVDSLRTESREVDTSGYPFSTVMESAAYMGPTRTQIRYVSDWVE